MNKYTYKVKVLLECEKEDCNFVYTRMDEHTNSYKMSEEDLLNFYDVLYEDILDNDKPHCPCCNSFLIESEILEYKEIPEKKRYMNLNVAVDNEGILINENNMRVLGVVIEGTDYNNNKEMLDLPLSEENYIRIYNQAKKYWDEGYLSKYVICFMNSLDRCFQYIRPDKNNFEKMESYKSLISEKNLDISEEYYNKNFTLGETTEDFKYRYEVNVVLNDIEDNAKDLEIL